MGARRSQRNRRQQRGRAKLKATNSRCRPNVKCSGIKEYRAVEGIIQSTVVQHCRIENQTINSISNSTRGASGFDQLNAHSIS